MMRGADRRSLSGQVYCSEHLSKGPLYFRPGVRPENRLSTLATEPAVAAARGSAAADGRIGLLPLVIVLAQLGIVTIVLRQFQIESAAFLRLALLAFAGFAVHALLPLRYRLPFFLALSLAGIGLVLGVVNGVWLVTHRSGPDRHVPSADFVRRAGVAAARRRRAVLALLRTEWLRAPWSAAIWPILGSMFMFRLIVYLYDLRHDEGAVDARAHARVFLHAAERVLSAVSRSSITRHSGATTSTPTRTGSTSRRRLDRARHHPPAAVPLRLLLPDARAVRGARTVRPRAVSWSSNFLLYLRVSGLFHLVVGMLYLFGFRLPETHHQYLLASSFTDFWRRINIYWKDFMLKIFYYPAFFRLRKRWARPSRWWSRRCSYS